MKKKTHMEQGGVSKAPATHTRTGTMGDMTMKKPVQTKATNLTTLWFGTISPNFDFAKLRNAASTPFDPSQYSPSKVEEKRAKHAAYVEMYYRTLDVAAQYENMDYDTAFGKYLYDAVDEFSSMESFRRSFVQPLKTAKSPKEVTDIDKHLGDIEIDFGIELGAINFRPHAQIQISMTHARGHRFRIDYAKMHFWFRQRFCGAKIYIDLKLSRDNRKNLREYTFKNFAGFQKKTVTLVHAEEGVNTQLQELLESSARASAGGAAISAVQGSVAQSAGEATNDIIHDVAAAATTTTTRDERDGSASSTAYGNEGNNDNDFDVLTSGTLEHFINQ